TPGRPFFHFGGKLLVAHGNWIAAFTWIPCPGHQPVLRHVLHNLGDAAMIVLIGVLELRANLSIRQALPDHRHRRRRQVPVRSAGRQVGTSKICALMTGTALLGSRTLPSGATPD